MPSTESENRKGDFRDMADIIRRYTNEQLELARKAADGEIIPLEPPEIARLLLPGKIVGKPVLSSTGRIAAVVECEGAATLQTVVSTSPLGCHFKTHKSGVESIRHLQFADCVKNTDPAFLYNMDGVTHFQWGDWRLTNIALQEDGDNVVDVLIDVGAVYYKQAIFLIHHSRRIPEYSVVHYSQSPDETKTYKFDAGYRGRAYSTTPQKDKRHQQLIGLFGGMPCWLKTNNFDGPKSDGILFWGKDRRSSQISNLRKDSLWYDGQRLTFVAYHLAKCKTCIFFLDKAGQENVKEIGPRDILVAHSQGNYFWPGDDKWPEQTTELHSSSDTWSQNEADFVWMNQLVGDGQGGVYAYRYVESRGLGVTCMLQYFNEAGKRLEGFGPCQIHAQWIHVVGSCLMAAHKSGVAQLRGREIVGEVLPPRNILLKDMVGVTYERQQMVLAVRSEGHQTVSLLQFA